MNASQYYVRIRGRIVGPFALAAVQQMIRKAQIGRSTEISTDGVVWSAASDFTELFNSPVAGGVGHVVEVEAPSDDPLGFDKLLVDNASPPSPPSSRSLMWHYTMKGVQQSSPVEQQTLINLIVAGQVGSDDSVWNETMANWSKVADLPSFAGYAIPEATHWQTEAPVANPSAQQQFTIYGERAPDFDGFVAKRVPAGVIALFLGNLGIHKFMLGLTTAGITMLLLFFLIIPIPVLAIISLIEGIVYLTKNEKQFYVDYAINKKQWF